MVTKTNTPANTDEPGDHDLVPSLPPTTEQSGTVDTVVLRYLDGRTRDMPTSTAGLVTGTGAPPPEKDRMIAVPAQKLREALEAAHRAGQSCGRLIGKESWDRAADYAELLVIVHSQVEKRD